MTNTGTKDIESFNIDVTDAIYPDAVFDPFGLAGDTTAKQMTITGGSGTGVQEPTGGYYIGAGGILGYEGVQLDFDSSVDSGFNPGESVAFAVDMDPNSIAGALKSTLDSGAIPAWDIGGISGAELIGSTFTITFTDGTTATGQLQGQTNGAGAALQGGSEGLASQDAAGTDVTLTVNGLAEGASGTYTDGGPTVILDGPIGATVRVTMTKGIIQPFDNNFPDTADPNEYHDQLDAQLAVLAASEFPANNSALFETFDVVLTEANQDISSLFNFTDVPGIDLAPRDEAQLPLGFVAGVIDPVTNQPIGPISSPIHLSYSENAAPTIDPIADIEIDEAQTASFNIVANDADGDTVALSVEVMRDIDGTIVDASAYSFTDNGDGTGSFSWETDEADDGSYSVAVTADDGLTQTTQSVGLIVNEIAGPQPGDILYRVNAGGAEVAASDGGPAWSADTQASNSPFLVNPGSNNDFPSNGQPNLSVDISMLSGTGAVAEMIGIERWDNTNDANGEMLWQFPVVAGTEIEVRLYLAELFGGLPDLDGSGDPTGDRIFDVSVDGTVPAAFTGLDPYALAGNAFNTGAVVSHTFTSDGIVDLEFLHVSENTAIKGIEIIVAGTPDTDGPTASLTAADVTTVDTTYTFEVTFSDATGVDVSTLDNLDVTVSNGALAFSATATLVSIDVPADGSPRTATYEITPPGGSWDGTDNGTYTVTLNDGEVGDILGNVAPQSVLGTFEVTAPSSNASALVEITPDGGLGDSTFTASSFQITNTSEPGVEITGVEIDLSTAILPDMVFDPTGAGGDATASGFTPNFGGVDTGLIAPADPFVDPFSQARNGGFDIITINFSDFDPGEQFFFTTDVDPNSIQAVPGAGNAGSVSGYELTGATVTVTFSDGRVVTGSLYEDGSLGGSQVLIDSDVVQVAPTIELIGAGPDESSLPGEQASVNNVDQIVRVTGTAGDNVSLLQMDARLFIASGNPPFDVSPDELPFYANEAMSGQTLYSATIGAGGFVDIPVMLLKTDGGATPDGGLNHFIAVTTPTPYAVDQATSLTSNTLIVKLGAELVYDAPGVMEFDGTTAGVLELEHQGDWAIPQGTVAFSFNAADTDGAQGLFSKDASGFVGGGNHFLIYLNGDTLTARFQNGIDGGNSVSLEVPGIVAGTEYEVAATFGPDGSEIWLNGNLVANDPLVMDWTTNVEFVQWGGRGWASSSGTAGFDAPFEGTISDKQIYAGVLSASEIAALAATSSGQNSPPTVTDDSAVTDEDVVLVINVADLVQNDSDVDGDSLDVSQIAVDPANGTAVLDGVAGTITYTPNPDFNGPDSFDVTVTDGINSVISTVNVTVNPVNDDPIAIDDVTSTVVDTPVIIDATSNDIDADGDTLNIAAVTQGSFGSVAIDPSGNTVTYTPNGGSTGTDSFTYTIDDGNGGVQDTATVTVSVLEAPNNPPVAVDDDDIVVDEDGSVTFQPGGNDTDSDGDTVVAAAIASDPSNGVAVVNADNTVTYTPNANYNGSDTFEVQVTDGNGGFDTSTVVVTVNAVNDAPVANNDAATTSQDTAVVINVLANDTDADLDGLTVTVVTDGDNGTVVSNGGSVTYTPNAGFVGDDSFTYTASDGEGGTNTATVNVTVNSFPTPVYDAPAEMVFDGSNGNVLELEPLPIYSFEEGTISFEFTASSLGNDRGLFSRDASGLTGNGNHIAVYVDNSVLTMRVQDGANTAFLTASGIVAGVSYDVAAVFAADGAKLYVDGVEADSSAVTTSWVNNPEYLQFGSLGWGSSTGGSGFRSQNNFQGSMSDKKIFSEALSDAQVAELHADGPINLSPIAVDDSVAATEDAGTVNIDVGANDSDPEMATVLADSIVADPTNGTAIVLADGTVDYTPDADFFGIDMFDVQVTDGAGGFDTSTVTVTVDGVEDDPVAVDDIASVQQDGQVTIDVLSNDSDADGDMLSVASNTNPSNGMVVDNLDGTFIYTPNAGFVGSDSFEYTLSDGAGPTDTATVSVTVNDSPVLPMPVFELPGVNTFDDSTSDVFNFAPDVALQQEAITVAFSFSADTFSGNQGLVVKDASFFGGGGHFAALLSGDDLDVRIQDTDSSFTLNLDNLNLGQEYEAAVVVSDNLAQLWVDGALIEETTSIDATWDTNTEYLQVGGLGWGSAAGDDSFSDPFSGQIADVEIYDVALSSDQIQQLADDSSFDLL
ncbi:MAG: Ig-like domain-containing protein [Pseudomonadota bacterium]